LRRRACFRERRALLPFAAMVAVLWCWPAVAEGRRQGQQRPPRGDDYPHRGEGPSRASSWARYRRRTPSSPWSPERPEREKTGGS
jgi:hypothetical protein